jgi:hypothetical protein
MFSSERIQSNDGTGRASLIVAGAHPTHGGRVAFAAGVGTAANGRQVWTK